MPARAEGDAPRPALDAYLLASSEPRPAVLVLPGSGYRHCSPREAEAFAVRFNAAGWHSFVLWYRCAPSRHPAPLLDCGRALTLIRGRATEWRIDPQRLAMLGFSAGGHLALSQTLFRESGFAAAPGIDSALARASALALGYPVVSSGEYAHRGSFDALLGANPSAETLSLLSLEKHISADLPPVFIWHTLADQAVPVENSLLLAAALRRAGVPWELHIFPEGKHGLALAAEETACGDPANINLHTAQWFPLCLRWLGMQFRERGSD